MDFKTAEACERVLRRVIAAHWSAAPAFREVVGQAKKKSKAAAWKKLENVDIGRDVDDLSEWLIEVLTKEAPDRRVNGLWFGLFETTGNRFCLYICGSRRFSLKNNLDWAVGPEWWPKRRYAKSRGIEQISRARPKRDFDTSWLMETCGVFPYAAIVVCELMRRVDPTLVLGAARKRGIACGFDEGDCFHLGMMTPNGFVPRAKA